MLSKRSSIEYMKLIFIKIYSELQLQQRHVHCFQRVIGVGSLQWGVAPERLTHLQFQVGFGGSWLTEIAQTFAGHFAEPEFWRLARVFGLRESSARTRVFSSTIGLWSGRYVTNEWNSMMSLFPALCVMNFWHYQMACEYRRIPQCRRLWRARMSNKKLHACTGVLLSLMSPWVVSWAGSRVLILVT